MEVQEQRLHKFVEAITDAVPSWDPVVLELFARQLIQKTSDKGEVSYGLVGGKRVIY